MPTPKETNRPQLPPHLRGIVPTSSGLPSHLRGMIPWDVPPATPGPTSAPTPTATHAPEAPTPLKINLLDGRTPKTVAELAQCLRDVDANAKTAGLSGVNDDVLRAAGTAVLRARDEGAFNDARFNRLREKLYFMKEGSSSFWRWLCAWLDGEGRLYPGWVNDANLLVTVAGLLETITAKAKPRRRQKQQRPPTPKQLEALKVVGECNQNFAEAGRRLIKNAKTVRQLYHAGLKNAGKLASKLIGKPKKQTAPMDARHQLDVAGDDDGPASSAYKPKKLHRNGR